MLITNLKSVFGYLKSIIWNIHAKIAYRRQQNPIFLSPRWFYYDVTLVSRLAIDVVLELDVVATFVRPWTMRIHRVPSRGKLCFPVPGGATHLNGSKQVPNALWCTDLKGRILALPNVVATFLRPWTMRIHRVPSREKLCFPVPGGTSHLNGSKQVPDALWCTDLKGRILALPNVVETYWRPWTMRIHWVPNRGKVLYPVPGGPSLLNGSKQDLMPFGAEILMGKYWHYQTW